MNNLLVETKQEYTTQLVNILTPLIFEGLQSIYQDAINNSSSDDVLKVFQLFLKRIPKWNNDMINRESNRIMNNSKSYTWLEDLIKATLKANISVLTYNPSIKTQIKINHSFYNNVNINDFIHKIYIECARDIWNNPYLFYHNFQPIDLKRNQRDAIITIKDCIREAIRKLLPVKHILNIYLGEEFENESPDDNFDKYISDIESKNLSKLIKKDLEYNNDSNNESNKNNINNNETNNNESNNNESNNSESNNNELNSDINSTTSIDNCIKSCSDSCYEKINKQTNKDTNKHTNKDTNNQTNKDTNNQTNKDTNNQTNKDTNNQINKDTNNQINKDTNKNKSDENTVGSQILNILNNKNLKLTEEPSLNNNVLNNNIDNKIKKILNNDLKGDSETSVNNNTNDFHEIFSNSSISNNNLFNNVNNKNIKSNFLANYLRV